MFIGVCILELHDKIVENIHNLVHFNTRYFTLNVKCKENVGPPLGWEFTPFQWAL